MFKTITATAFTLALLLSGASAQQSGTEAEQKACAPDVKKFCPRVLDQGDLVILSCLQQNRPNISPACNQVLVNHGQ
ncbi:hypothetical protein FNL55_08175 [Tardiphaga sp. vice352]|uniref:cysteine rich repeat-containing protein n=1 Tax=unclassified Tardiphaga TaxID=2631404 RepID=UPI001164E19C|nr:MULTISPECIES: cysteine rich repeat-containing protein [unclassified Tardiphaga]MBC7583551.1 hypothetical protein [Tardiphaga sp.]QDM15927.1 hypothetical protein FNL53_08445 [Tardiphaga sp. vice278]QDM21028.1 hypothetical protein FIU28_07810 [Tardiphaga sp. vice154]QDM26124.1 hypothetical protein FNL56_08530 [Tardiphaga sp. vice304]QDM31272.1 hypothetical protein FNL55_08175 [Tardiphaga sp. vice352]